MIDIGVKIMGMICFDDLRRKEVVNMRDGVKLGAICDMELDESSGLVQAIIVPGAPRFFGLLRSDEEIVIPYCKICKIGDDVILVDIVV